MSSDSPIVKLYVGNVSSRMRTTELEDLFKPFGTVVKIEIKTGYAFVDVAGVASVSELISETNQTTSHGQMLRVELSHSANSDGRSRPIAGSGRCFSCGEEGHWRNECPRQQDLQRRDRDDPYREEYRRSDGALPASSSSTSVSSSSGYYRGGGSSGTDRAYEDDRTHRFDDYPRADTHDDRRYDERRYEERRYDERRYDDHRIEDHRYRREEFDDRRAEYARVSHADRYHPYQRRSPPPVPAPHTSGRYSPPRYRPDDRSRAYAPSRRSPERLPDYEHRYVEPPRYGSPPRRDYGAPPPRYAPVAPYEQPALPPPPGPYRVSSPPPMARRRTPPRY